MRRAMVARGRALRAETALAPWPAPRRPTARALLAAPAEAPAGRAAAADRRSWEMEKHQKTAQKHKTGASDLEFDLFSEMHSLLKGNNALQQYVEDAREHGDPEAEAVFKTIHEQNKENVAKLREVLSKHIAKAA
jgi:hypothetical protein